MIKTKINILRQSQYFKKSSMLDECPVCAGILSCDPVNQTAPILFSIQNFDMAVCFTVVRCTKPMIYKLV